MIEKDLRKWKFSLILNYNHVASSDFCAQRSVISDLQFIPVNTNFKIHEDEIDVFYLGGSPQLSLFRQRENISSLLIIIFTKKLKS